ncbi:proteasome accessory factor C [Halopolyspora algeriensis]|uniref:Proteasome accessory factor C n=1 Tax=Halopolyspora algeriensis TaxID=1500506 RepID=A0A368VLC2_9ACTN|nr:YafY family protein [Halopolyspora algeriensis]RCW40475.1 proteasome accessory factor C [Halopolyspora algeriensis]TQM53758.1 proteasome accessory factor C [Halopolyspora algeriensis]
MTGAAERLPRLLALIPYLVSRPGIAVAQAAEDFGVAERQLRRDLELLWMCGLPGYGPGDLIDLSFGSDTVTVTYDAGMRRPLRLTTSEATSLLVALRALADSPGITDTAAVRRALAKVEDAVGQTRSTGVVVGLAGREHAVRPGVHDAVREATTHRKAVRMRYYTASRDEVTDRTVDPMRLVLLEGHSYLEAWCRRAEGVRLFRLDRIDAIEVVDEPAAPPPDVEPTDFSAGLFRPMPDQPSAELELEPDAHWVAEYYPVDEFTELPQGRVRVRMRYSDRSWMVRLVLGLGGQARVCRPPELADEVRRRALEAMTRADNLLST